MSAGYVAVQWNRGKIVYDLVLILAVIAYTQVFQLLGRGLFDEARMLNSQILAMRAWGSCAFVMLTAILMIGPLARLDRRFLPLLYNRRHFGVIFFFVGLHHARQVLGFYHAYSEPRISQLESLLTFDASFAAGAVPFQLFGAAALVYFAVMAATSHDLWQKFLGPRVWKSLHMGVYFAWFAVVMHVAFGALQVERHPVWLGLVALSVLAVAGLHLTAARASREREASTLAPSGDGVVWIDAGAIADLEDGVPRSICPPKGERIALVRDGDAVTAFRSVCAHQGGPLDEGRVIDGCLTCPWHGWQYRSEDGQSPPPFDEKIPTHEVRTGREGHLVVKATPEPLDRPAAPFQLGENR